MRTAIISILVLTAVMMAVSATIAFAADQPSVITVQPHGFMQNRFYSAPAAGGEFRNERISFSLQASGFPNESNAYLEVYYHPYASSSGLYLESAYYDTPFAGGRLRVGKGRRITFGITPSYGNRRTSNYGLVSEAFTQDRIQGVQWVRKTDQFDYAFAFHTAYRLGTRNIGEIPGDDVRNTTHQVPHLCLRDVPGALSHKLAFSGRIGHTMPGGARVGISYSTWALDDRDIDDLDGTTSGLLPKNPLTGSATTTPLLASVTDKKAENWGFDMSWKKKSFIAQAEYYLASISDLDYSAWSVLFGWEPPKGLKFYARYGSQDSGLAATKNPLSWDTKQISFSVVQPIAKSVWLQYEFETNAEDTYNGEDVRNNLFFVELFTGF